MTMHTAVDVLVPTRDRPAPLSVTLACISAQTYRPARVVVADQGDLPCADAPTVRAVTEVMRVAGIQVEIRRNMPRRGMAQQRQFLLDRTTAPYALFVDDDVITEPDLLGRLVDALAAADCGFVGSFPNSPSSVASDEPVDRVPSDLTLERWNGVVEPEAVWPDSTAWQRYRLHFAARLHRLCEESGIDKAHPVLYRVAWVGGCFLVDTAKLREAGGFGFWRSLPSTHSGEDVVAQLRLQALHGAAGLAPSGSWHQEVRTTRPGDEPDAPRVLDMSRHGAGVPG